MELEFRLRSAGVWAPPFPTSQLRLNCAQELGEGRVNIQGFTGTADVHGPETALTSPVCGNEPHSTLHYRLTTCTMSAVVSSDRLLVFVF